MSWMTRSNASARFVLRWFRVRLVIFAPRVIGFGPEPGVEFSGTHPAKGSWKVTLWISRDDSSGIEPSNGQPFRCKNQSLLPTVLEAVKLPAPALGRDATVRTCVGGPSMPVCEAGFSCGLQRADSRILGSGARKTLQNQERILLSVPLSAVSRVAVMFCEGLHEGLPGYRRWKMCRLRRSRPRRDWS